MAQTYTIPMTRVERVMIGNTWHSVAEATLVVLKTPDECETVGLLLEAQSGTICCPLASIQAWGIEYEYDPTKQGG